MNLVIILLIVILLILVKQKNFTNITTPYKIAVITSIFGNYENLKDHLNVQNYNAFDWYCFTDNIKQKKKGVWTIINTPYHLQNETNQTYKNSFNNITDENTKNMMYAKYYKAQMHKIDILQDYDYYIWIDGSIKLRPNFVNNLIKLINLNKDIDLINFRHSARSNIKDEVYYCKDWPKYKAQDLEYQYKYYLKNGFPDNIGLFELTSFYRKNNDRTNAVFDDWWIQNQQFSYQDQVSFPYSLWKSNKINQLILDENVMNNDKYCYNGGHLKNPF